MRLHNNRPRHHLAQTPARGSGQAASLMTSLVSCMRTGLLSGRWMPGWRPRRWSLRLSRTRPGGTCARPRCGGQRSSTCMSSSRGSAGWPPTSSRTPSAPSCPVGHANHVAGVRQDRRQRAARSPRRGGPLRSLLAGTLRAAARPPGRRAWGHRAAYRHVGSTAVPGLPAKTVIDVQVSIAGLDDESRYVAQIERAGYHIGSVKGNDLHGRVRGRASTRCRRTARP